MIVSIYKWFFIGLLPYFWNNDLTFINKFLSDNVWKDWNFSCKVRRVELEFDTDKFIISIRQSIIVFTCLSLSLIVFWVYFFLIMLIVGYWRYLKDFVVIFFHLHIWHQDKTVHPSINWDDDFCWLFYQVIFVFVVFWVN